MTENSQFLSQGQSVTDHPSVQSGTLSINSDTVEVDVRVPNSNQLSTKLTPEQLKEVQQKANKLETSKYFALKNGYFETAVEECKSELYFTEVDGNIIGAWLVTEIDHWDNEKERLVILTEKQLIVVRFNFITTKIEDYRKIPLVNCTRIQTGHLNYTGATFLFYQQTTRRREQLGLRIHWNSVKVPGTFDYWNPWSHDIPYLTLTSHTSVEVNEASPDFVNFTAFQKSLIAAASSDVSRSLVMDEEPILIHVILGISAVVHNQSKLGFSRDRGGVCF